MTEDAAGAKPREPKTLWRLVEARCNQITDAISAARLPFLLGLTWSFIWVSALYVSEFSYTKDFRSRLLNLNTLAQTEDSLGAAEFKRFCLKLLFAGEKEYVFAGKKFDYDERLQLQHCKLHVAKRFEFADKTSQESMVITLPWNLGRMNTDDFGIIGNCALILILSWTFFALRRENHAVKGFVDFHPLTQPRWGFCYPDPFVLCPKDRHLSDEHYAYSYHAVCQRFMFLVSTHSWPLFLSTVALGSVPALVYILTFASDLNSVIKHWHVFEPSVFVRFSIGTLLTLAVLIVTGAIVKIMLDTSVLLNGWYLAVEKVWMDAWNETTDKAATMVLIRVADQEAEPIDNPQMAIASAASETSSDSASRSVPI
jgi:hypothetical protein